MQVQVSLRDAREGGRGAVPRTHLHRTCSALQVQVCGSGQVSPRRAAGSRGPNGVRRKATSHEGHCIGATGCKGCLRMSSSDSFTASQDDVHKVIFSAVSVRAWA